MNESEEAPRTVLLPAVQAEAPRDTRFQPGRSGNPSTRFQPGQSGNPLGSRAKCRFRLSEAFVRGLWRDFQKHGPEAIAEVREKRPQDYLKIVASLVPRQLPSDDGEVVIGALIFNGINDDATLQREREDREAGPVDYQRE